MNYRLVLFSALNYLTAILPLLLSLVLARNMSAELYGLYMLSLVGFNIFSIVGQIGSDKTLIIALSRSENPRNTLFNVTKAKWSAFVIVSMLLLIVVAFGGVVNSQLYFLFFGALTGLFFALSPRQWHDFNSTQHIGQIILFLERLIFVIVSLCIVCFFKPSKFVVLAIVIMSLILRLFSTLFDTKLIMNKCVSIQFFSLRQLRIVFVDNVFIILASLGNLLMTQANQLALSSVSGVASLASFGLAMQFVSVIRLGQRQFLRLQIRNLSELNKDAEKIIYLRTLRSYTLKSLLITLSLGTLIYAVFPVINRYFLHNEYKDVRIILLVLIAWMMVLGVSLGLNQLVLTRGLRKSYFYVTIFYGILSLFLSVKLSIIYSGLGTAIALLMSHLMSVLTQLYLVLKDLKKN